MREPAYNLQELVHHKSGTAFNEEKLKSVVLQRMNQNNVLFEDKLTSSVLKDRLYLSWRAQIVLLL